MHNRRLQPILDKTANGSLAMTAAAVAALLACRTASAQEDWKSRTITPVTNPIYFEDPKITGELRPIFMYHFLPDTFEFSGGSVPLGGDVKVYALQARIPLSDRLAIIATKDGYIQFEPDQTLTHEDGWADLAGGLKYALVQDDASHFILTPGFTFTVPTGSTDVMQGRGSGEWNVFTSAVKGWGDFHLTGNVGVRIPNDFDSQTAQVHYSAQLDYFLCRYFIPFFAANAYTILTEGDHKLLGAVDLNTEMYDLINFGSTEAGGRTQVTVGGGLRSRLLPSLDLGVAYEVGVTEPVGIFDSRVTVDVIWRW